MCTAVLIGWDPATPAIPLLLVSKDRRHLFVTPWLNAYYRPYFQPISNQVRGVIGKGSHRLNINLPDTTTHFYRPIRDQCISETAASYQLGIKCLNGKVHLIGWTTTYWTLHASNQLGIRSQWKGPSQWLINDLTHTACFQPIRDQVSQRKGPSHLLNNDLPHTARFQPITGSGVSMQRHLTRYLGKNSSVSSGAGYHRLEIALKSQLCTSSNSSGNRTDEAAFSPPVWRPFCQ